MKMNLPLYKGPLEEIEDRELVVKAGAADPMFFCHYFFPRAYRQEDPPFARRVWRQLLDPTSRYANVMMFRGAAKTTNIRALTAYRIAYGMSRVILYVGKSDEHAVRSVGWLRRHIRFNRRWLNTFGMSRGEKFSEGTLELVHGVEGHHVFITAAGIEGSLRGINFDDYRPDLIVLDDIVDKEKVNTALAVKKMTDLVYGDILRSLEAESDNPNAMLINLGTPLMENDPTMQMSRDPMFSTIRVPCWTEETLDLPVEKQESAWPARYPSETLRKEKLSAIRTNKLYLWLQEMELQLTSPETQSFKSEWYREWDILPDRDECEVVLVVDPVPPPSEKQIAEGLAKKDYEAFGVVLAHRSGFYVAEVMANRGHEPDWTVWAFFHLAEKWRVPVALVEQVAYQRTLQWLLRKEMKRRRHYVQIKDFKTGRRSKHDVIVDSLVGPCSEKRVFFPPNEVELRRQFCQHPDVEHDDLLEVAARGVGYLMGKKLRTPQNDRPTLEEEETEGVEPLGNWRLVT